MAVIINGRTAVHKGSNGTLVTQDDCYTGPNNQVVTYQNIAKSADATNCAKTVFINGNPICHKNSYFSKSTGDEAGNGGGVKSGTIQGKAEFVTASPNVFIEGIPAVRAGDLMVSNNRNTPPAALQQASPPFGGDQDKINKFPLQMYPKVTYDLAEVAPQSLPASVLESASGNFSVEAKISVNGNITLQHEGEHNPLVFDLTKYELEAKQNLGSFVASLKYNKIGSNSLEIGNKLTSDTWDATIIPMANGFTAIASPKEINSILNNLWKISGAMGITIEAKYQPLPPTLSAKVSDFIVVYAEQVIDQCIGATLALAILTLAAIAVTV